MADSNMALSKLDEIRNLHRISELTTYNLVSLRTQCLDDVRVKAEIKTLEAKLDNLLVKQVVLKRESEETGLFVSELREYPDTSLWLRKLDLERCEQLFATNLITCDLLLRMNDREVTHLLKHELRVDRSAADRIVVSLKAIQAQSQSPNADSTSALSRTSTGQSQLAERAMVVEHGTAPTQRRISHSIAHRFNNKLVLAGMCNYCRKIMLSGMVCQYCRYSCHSKCAKLVPPTCGLPKEYEDYFKTLITVTMAGSELEERRPSSMDQFQSIPEDSPVLSATSVRSSRGDWRRLSFGNASMHRVKSLPGFQDELSPEPRPETPPDSNEHGPKSPRTRSRVVAADMQRSISFPHGHQVQAVARGPMPRPASTSALPLPPPGRDYQRTFSGGSTSTAPGSGHLASTPGTPPRRPPQLGPQSIGQGSRRRGLSVSVPSGSPPMLDSQRPSRRRSVEFQKTSGVPGRYRGNTVGSPRLHRQNSASSSPLAQPASPRSLRGSRTTLSLGGIASPIARNTFFGQQRERGELADWEIPYSELIFVKRLGEPGPGEVHQAKWHGDVAVKVWTVDDPSEEMLRGFRREVSTLRKLRHQNILLFMGACVSPPHFAIVTKFCNGSTLYRHIHVLETHFTIEHIVDMLTQLAQGMEYLHARRVVKRKLTSKSVFVEMDSKVMIGDFSLATMTGLPVPGSPRPRFHSTGSFSGASPYNSPHLSPRGSVSPYPPGSPLALANPSSVSTLPLPDTLAKIGPLRYLAPEILETSSAAAFTFKSDVYAFAVVTYELLAMELPWQSLLPEQVIFTVVTSRRKPELSACRGDCPSALLDIVSSCLEYKCDARPSFEDILKVMQSREVMGGVQQLSIQRTPSLPASSPVRRESNPL